MRSARPGPALWADMHRLADCAQKVVGIDIGADLAGGDRSLEQRAKGGLESLLEVRAQGVEGRVSRVQGRGEPAFGCNKGRVALHPSRQRFAWLVLGSENRCGVGAGVDFAPEDGHDEVGALRKVAIYGADADAGLVGDLPHRSVHPRSGEHRQRRFQQGVVFRCASARTGRDLGPRAQRHRLPRPPSCSFQNLHLLNGTSFRI